MFLMVISEILPLFVNILSVDHKFFFLIGRIHRYQFKCNFFLYFWNWNKMNLKVYQFLKLRTAKDVVNKMSKKPRSRAPFNSQHAKGPKHYWNLHGNPFIIFTHNSEENRVGKLSLLVISRILAWFVNILTLDLKYSLCNPESSFWIFEFTSKICIVVNILKRKIILTAYVFLQLKTAKDVVR